ncbi:response regulator transcription factor [Paenibacillus sp. PR3]|uniref:Response regulator transcription factor n=1 Tax=Paenibacillus terricola TaxID=2763503 RepID=A0ABR8MVX2_9BACL|nr:response regulator transcription factor [Paenibacillus terricola]MBD3919735.1 response regulator transcription factor [Paenibacillus terricola]
MKTTILIVDDHVLIRKGIRLLLEGLSGLEITGEACDGTEAILLAERHRPDVILMDLSMPDGLDGFAASQIILSKLKSTKIIVLTMHDEEIYVRKALQLHIHGYLLKNSQANEIQEAIRAVMSGERYYKTQIPEEQLSRLMKVEGTESVLTLREREILRLTALGYTNIQISQQLSISPKTVENHKSNMMQKLQLKDKHDLIKYAIKNKFIDLF